ncbi:hypothetical protein MMC31_003406 [Peltigera leucophlebia]|nr:hypothetical protein [Peltigera leucophlebia]
MGKSKTRSVNLKSLHRSLNTARKAGFIQDDAGVDGGYVRQDQRSKTDEEEMALMDQEYEERNQGVVLSTISTRPSQQGGLDSYGAPRQQPSPQDQYGAATQQSRYPAQQDHDQQPPQQGYWYEQPGQPGYGTKPVQPGHLQHQGYEQIQQPGYGQQPPQSNPRSKRSQPGYPSQQGGYNKPPPRYN